MNEHRMERTKKRQNIVMWVALAAILYFLITEHWAHVVPYLPWLILLACPFLHLFMHGGHGHGGHGNGGHESHGQHGEQDRGGH